MRLKHFVPLALMGLAITLLTAAGLDHRLVASAGASATEANITRVTTSLLEHSQFSHHPLDNELAGKFLDCYLDALDGGHVLFLQSDITEFDGLRNTLARDTRLKGDTSAARLIFDRYLERSEERAAWVTNLLATGKFDFTGHQVYSFDRKDAPRPRDLAAAHDLWTQQLRAEYLQEKLGGSQPVEIASTLTHRYTQQVRSLKEMNRDDVLEIYLDALAHVYDPHSDYMGHEQMDSFAIAMNLSLFGIGATLQSDDGYCTIHELVPGGPAARSKLLNPGDRIVAVAQAGKNPVDVVNMPLSHVVELIRGAKGSVVHLTILPASSGKDSVEKTIRLVRDEIKLDDEQAKAQIVNLPVGEDQTVRLGVINLPSFYADMDGRHGKGYRSASADVAALLGKLEAEHVQGVILDLRLNGGGSLDEAINLAGLFIPRGPVVQTLGPEGDIQVGVSETPAPLYNGPLIVLTSRYSASASEIVTGALQDYGRALIVGDSMTFGKGTVQNIVALAPLMDQYGLRHAYDPGALKVTIRKFYRPSGASTQLKGVASDIVVPSPSEVSGVSESALEDPLPWDTVPASDYQPMNRVQPYLATLREKSARRVATEKDFVYLREDIALLKKSETDKTVSLNETERRQEMARFKALQGEIDRENQALRATAPVTYDITLNNAALPGLPPPVANANSPASAHNGRPAKNKNGPDVAAADAAATEDIILTETEHILADYAALINQSNRPVLSTR
jgi:carboxyl-terminal processing protease